MRCICCNITLTDMLLKCFCYWLSLKGNAITYYTYTIMLPQTERWRGKENEGKTDEVTGRREKKTKNKRKQKHGEEIKTGDRKANHGRERNQTKEKRNWTDRAARKKSGENFGNVKGDRGKGISSHSAFQLIFISFFLIFLSDWPFFCGKYFSRWKDIGGKKKKKKSVNRS